MRSKAELKARFRNHLAGLALHGHVSEVRDSTLARGARVLEIPDEVDRLLDAIWEFLAADVAVKENANHGNGNGRK